MTSAAPVLAADGAAPVTPGDGAQALAASARATSGWGRYRIERPLSFRYAEPFALLIARLAYEGEGGPELAYRFERFGA
jgi:hypothetical protein